MWVALGMLLIIGWVMLKVVWHVASFAVHLLLVGAVIAVIVHFVRGRFSRQE